MGNARDPSEGRETPWIDLAHQLAGNKGVAALGSAAATTPPGTEAINRVFAAAEAPVLLLFDEMLNFVNQHRDRAESFHTFTQNLTVAITGTAGAAVLSPSFSTPHYPAESRRRPPRPRPVRAARLNVGPIRAQIRLDSAFPERYLRSCGTGWAPRSSRGFEPVQGSRSALNSASISPSPLPALLRPTFDRCLLILISKRM